MTAEINENYSLCKKILSIRCVFAFHRHVLDKRLLSGYPSISAYDISIIYNLSYHSLMKKLQSIIIKIPSTRTTIPEKHTGQNPSRIIFRPAKETAPRPLRLLSRFVQQRRELAVGTSREGSCRRGPGAGNARGVISRQLRPRRAPKDFQRSPAALERKMSRARKKSPPRPSTGR